MNIEKLLNKKGWKGAELGRLEIYNALYAYGMALQGSPDPKGVVTPAEFKKMLDTLKDPQEIRDYNNYICLHEWVLKQVNQAHAHQQQALLHFQTLFKFLICAKATEQTYQYIEQLPHIITEKQLEDRKEEIKAPYFTGKLELSVANLIAWAVVFLIDDYKSNPRKKSVLKPLKKVLEAQTITSRHILSSYNEVWGNGAFILPSGKRSDAISVEEWLEAVEPTLAELERKYQDGKLTTVELVSAKSSIENAYSSAEKELAPYGFVWKYDEAPESLNKWAVTTEDEFIESFYQGLTADPVTAEQEQREALEAFKEENPELLEASLGYMESYFKGISSMPYEDWTKPLYSWKDLYSTGFAGFTEADFDDPLRLWDGNYRAVNNGIAIYQPTAFSKRWIDEKGHYKAPELTKELEPLMLDALFTESEYYADAIDTIDGARELLLDSYYFLLGYNKILDLIEELLEVEGLGVLHVRANGLEAKAEQFNFISKSLYRMIQNTVYEEKFLREKKLEVLEQFFKPLHFEELQLPEEAIEATRRAIYSFKGFKEDAYNPITLLCIRHKEEKGV